MAGKFHKPLNLKYTDMCIYIDKNMYLCAESNKYPELEERIFQYLYHIVYALSLKAGYFTVFDDYETFSMQTAAELFIALRDKYINAGKESRGKIIEPVKNTLDYIKAVLFPLKINYQRQNFATVINPAVGSGPDTSIIEQDMKDSIRSNYRNNLGDDLYDVLSQTQKFIDDIVHSTPYKNDPVMCENLKISCLLTLLSQMTLPNKLLDRIDRTTDMKKQDERFLNSYTSNEMEVILWHLPSGLTDYVKILVMRLKHKISNELNETRSMTDLSDEIVDSIMKTAYATYDMQDGD